MSAIVYLTDENFEKKIADSKQPMLVDFWAEWCGPCRAIAPLLEELAEAHPNVTIAKMDIENHPEQSAKRGIMSIPTLILFKNGQESERVMGANPEKIRALVQTADQ